MAAAQHPAQWSSPRVVLHFEHLPVHLVAAAELAQVFSAPSYMVRNLYMVKVRPFCPMRSCAKKTDPRESRRIRHEYATYASPQSMSPNSAPTISMIRFATSASVSCGTVSSERT